MAENRATFWKIGVAEIYAPDPGQKLFWIYADVAELLGCEFTSDAVARFRAAWKARGKKGRVGIDAEADGASFTAGREGILQVAELLNVLAIVPVDRNAFERQKAMAHAGVMAYVVPKPREWKLGDVFHFELRNGSFAYGQVVGDIVPSRASRQPTCALFDLHTSSLVGLEEIRKRHAISVLHVSSVHLDTGRWRIIGFLPPLASPYTGPCGHPFEKGGTSWDGLEELANAYFGLAPWNNYYKDDYLDEYLLAGVSRPKSVVILDDVALAAHGTSRKGR